MTAPTGRPRLAHQRTTSSSDRKSRIVAQVNPISSHQEAAGTAKWTTPDPAESARPVVRIGGGSPQSEQLVLISAGAWSMAEMPRASQAQLAHHSPSDVRTRKAVGTAENGMAI